MRGGLAVLLALAVAAPAAAQPEAEDWTRHLPGLAPALRACLSGDPAAYATAAMPLNHGRALVRLRRADGGREDCVAEILGPDPAAPARVERREPTAPGDRLPAEGERAFFLDRRCVDARRVDGPNGAVLGWLAYPGCG